MGIAETERLLLRPFCKDLEFIAGRSSDRLYNSVGAGLAFVEPHWLHLLYTLKGWIVSSGLIFFWIICRFFLEAPVNAWESFLVDRVRGLVSSVRNEAVCCYISSHGFGHLCAWENPFAIKIFNKKHFILLIKILLWYWSLVFDNLNQIRNYELLFLLVHLWQKQSSQLQYYVFFHALSITNLSSE